MSEPFIGQIIQFAGNFAPRSWAFCDGQLLPIAQHTALFSILGTTYGGDGRTTFALPDLRGRVPMHPGNGPGLTSRRLGERSGSETNTITTNQMPPHSHEATLNAEKKPGDSADPNGKMLSASGEDTIYGDPIPRPDAMLSPSSITVGSTGAGQSVNNMQPYEAINFIIALEGIYPSRS